ncbi:MAG: diaminopimelate decarboxylase [Eubacteriales bacterium]|nr:diaminopimelate decarboxylase [Eubacteriales bacterium]MDD4421780.1 diaminopimelate decarboxylase [Eubacteriales bacterium]
MLHDNIKVGENGHLYFAGMDTVDLAKKYGTPLYLMDENKLRENCRTFLKCIQKHFGEKSIPIFASKAISYLDIYRILKSEGIATDVVSGGEIFAASKAGFSSSMMFFHGNNKTDAEIEYALKSDVGYFVVDNREELDEVAACAKKHGKVQRILLRLAPGIDPHTHKAVVTGSVDSKFGVAIETGQAMELTKYALSKNNVKLIGFHCHIGSLIFENTPFSDAAEIMLSFIAEVRKQTGFTSEMLNLGGGLPSRYIEEHPTVDLDKTFAAIKAVLDRFLLKYDIRKPVIAFELGRYICANAGMTLYTVGSFKSITGYKNYISIDGGMADNPRYALYQSPYTVLVADRAGEDKTVIATIAGRCCESGDIIQEDVKIQPCKKGDILAVLVTGAYNYSMCSNYNRLPKPAMVCIKNKVDRVVVERESYEDMCKNEL